MRGPLRAWLVAALTAGCSPTDPCANVAGACVALTVDGHGDVDTLRLSLSGAAAGSRFAPVEAKVATLPVYLALQLAHADPAGNVFAGGAVDILVEASLATHPVGAGLAHVTVGRDAHVNATVALSTQTITVDDLATTTAPADLAMACVPGDLAALASDPRNCGACGHDCLGGGCMAGQCQPVTLVTGRPSLAGIALDGSNVYFAQPGGAYAGVQKLPMSGGAPTLLTPGSVTGLALAGTTLVVADSGAWASSLRVPDGAGGLMRVVQTSIDKVASDGVNVYFAGAGSSPITSLPLPLTSGTNPGQVGTAPVPVQALATDGTTVYFAGANGIGGIPVPSGSATIYNGVAGVTALAIDGGALWAATGTTLIKYVRQGSTLTATQTLSGPTSSVAGLAVDASAVYWTQQDGSVFRIAK